MKFMTKWKGKRKKRTDKEKEKETKKGKIEEWDKEDEMGKMGDPYDKL